MAKPSPTPKKKLLRNDVDANAFASLSANAFEFLARSVADFDASPKFSVVHFCAALEMLVKARLLREHWSLIVSKTDRAKRDSFFSGSFVSVTLEECWARLKEVVGLQMDERAWAAFQAISQHRNKLIHFYHRDLEGDANARGRIVSEQAAAWFHLHRLLLAWPDFLEFKSQIEQAERSMRQHKKYLVAKAEALKPELDLLIQKGTAISACRVCEQPTAVHSAINTALTSLDCLTCQHADVAVRLKCPHCEAEAQFASDKICSACEATLDDEALVDAFVDPAEAFLAARDGEPTNLASCESCDGYQTVIPCGDKFLCIECFDVVDHVQNCGSCGEPNTGDMEDSFYSGCNHCEGFAGRFAND